MQQTVRTGKFEHKNVFYKNLICSYLSVRNRLERNQPSVNFPGRHMSSSIQYWMGYFIMYCRTMREWLVGGNGGDNTILSEGAAWKKGKKWFPVFAWGPSTVTATSKHRKPRLKSENYPTTMVEFSALINRGKWFLEIVKTIQILDWIEDKRMADGKKSRSRNLVILSATNLISGPSTVPANINAKLR